MWTFWIILLVPCIYGHKSINKSSGISSWKHGYEGARCDPRKYGIRRDRNGCQCYFECNDTKVAVKKCCRSGWLNDKDDVKNIRCKKPDAFHPLRQDHCFNLMKELKGTTPNLKDVFIGRCLEYQQFIQPKYFKEKPKKCNELYQSFISAFSFKPPCGKVFPGQFYKFIKHAHMDDLPTDKLLFYSSIYQLSQDYSNRGKRLFTLESTLLGHLVDKLNWCGQSKNPGINFGSCPTWSYCENNPMTSFWQDASTYFGSLARGIVTVMLDGSDPKKPPFRESSFFTQFELQSLLKNCKSIERIRIWVVHQLDKPELVQETCDTENKTLKKLMAALEEKGCKYSCEDNPMEVKNLLCLNNPHAEECRPKQGH